MNENKNKNKRNKNTKNNIPSQFKFYNKFIELDKNYTNFNLSKYVNY